MNKTVNFHSMTEDTARMYVQRFWEEYQDMALQLVVNVGLVDQRTHVTSFDDLSSWGKAQLEHRHSWMFGHRSVGPLLQRVAESIDEGERLSPVMFLDLMYLVDRLPLVKAQALAHGTRFPEPNPYWISGWYTGDGREFIMNEPVRDSNGAVIAIPRSIDDTDGRVIGRRAE